MRSKDQLMQFPCLSSQADIRGITLTERQRFKHQLRRSASSLVSSSRPAAPLLWARGGGGLVQWVLFLSVSLARKSQHQLSQGSGHRCSSRGADTSNMQSGGTERQTAVAGDRVREKKQAAATVAITGGSSGNSGELYLCGGERASETQESSGRGKAATKAACTGEEASGVGGETRSRGGGGAGGGRGGGLAAIAAAVAAAEGGGQGGTEGEDEIEISIESPFADEGGGQVSEGWSCKSLPGVQGTSWGCFCRCPHWCFPLVGEALRPSDERRRDCAGQKTPPVSQQVLGAMCCLCCRREVERVAPELQLQSVGKGRALPLRPDQRQRVSCCLFCPPQTAASIDEAVVYLRNALGAATKFS